jgi:hypothetical protein
VIAAGSLPVQLATRVLGVSERGATFKVTAWVQPIAERGRQGEAVASNRTIAGGEDSLVQLRL